ncbi:MAG TPA: Rrf2 family transcriptional regulator [Bacteroidia bacterium]
MIFSKACEYAIRATMYVALQSLENKRVSLKDISREIDSPEAFTAKVLQQLTKSGIISSLKGPTGGFVIDKLTMESTSLSQVVYAIEGDAFFKGCGLGLKACSEIRPCPLHNRFKIIREELRIALENTNLYDLSLGVKGGLTFLKK